MPAGDSRQGSGRRLVQRGVDPLGYADPGGFAGVVHLAFADRETTTRRSENPGAQSELWWGLPADLHAGVHNLHHGGDDAVVLPGSAGVHSVDGGAGGGPARGWIGAGPARVG